MLRRQLYVNLGGTLEVEVSDGEVRRLESGDVVLAQDLDGAGHITRVVGYEPADGLFVPGVRASPLIDGSAIPGVWPWTRVCGRGPRCGRGTGCRRTAS